MREPSTLRLIDPKVYLAADLSERRTGYCPLCGRKVTRHMATRNGATCRYELATFDRQGYFTGYAKSRKVPHA